ncbi:MAG: carbohydrate ABC transporter permease [Candidatus Hydrogenedentota bacterium]|jgi:arabinogalactan oligomer/maltooligosaccharide transport system permease protein|uniref:Maltose/maltodextrin ABC transporter, permease protein MalG n=1 Tax=Sumerlaea chitinivorans TaxID=2250252 RepID=A0A2Z4Y4M1_SUMC1|nr:Maltose/maltodextrin ABC transporter, permease protein MalG [Candidatus Sumerlaea chitinivorans]MCX7964691.1 carbohydrate ABC transporter permease [Candidatus Sumerlaea chitinivorans]RMH28282.1 MAG: carbohydrate ABC transporter permease [Candidatus Hydrogenedentota bacterium]GIX45673.1 MAG: ABC transporter permease [Candidatus Sumerlaea sp.]
MRRATRTAIATHFWLILASIISIFPIVWVVSTSLKYKEDVYQTTRIEVIPSRPNFSNYVEVLTMNNGIFLTWFRNSALVAGATALFGVLLAASAAYAFSRFSFRAKKPLIFFFLVTQMFPGAVLLVPLYFLLQRMGLLGSFPGLIIAYCTVSLPFGVWMLKSYFDTIPKSLDEAGIVDGLSIFGVFWRIIVPLSLPGIAVTAFFAFLTAWNEYMFALAFMTGEKNYLLPVGMAAAFGDQYQTFWHLMAAGSVLTTLPVLAVFVFAQRFLISGLTQGGVKQ